MKIEQISEDEIEDVIADISRHIRGVLRRFASSKKEDILLQELRSSDKPEYERVCEYMARTTYLLVDLERGLPRYERPYAELMRDLHIDPANAQALRRKLVREQKATVKTVNDQVVIKFGRYRNTSVP